MRLHRHQVGKAVRWHSVRARHDDAWDWCAHQEEVEQHLARKRSEQEPMSAGKGLKLQTVR